MQYGLIGEPLGHSFSKGIHERIADYTYDLHPLSKDEFPTFMKARNFRAINVTIPYKKAVIPYLDVLDPYAKSIGAVNTIVHRDGRLFGYNTDAYGFLYTLQKHGIHVAQKHVLVLGNGGASAAIQAVLHELGVGTCVVVARHATKEAISYATCYQDHLDAQVIINTTPVGMYPSLDASPLDIRQFTRCEALVDIIYNPLATTLVTHAKQQGIRAVNGLEMLVAQAKKSVEYFLQQDVRENVIDTIYQDLYKQQMNVVLIGMPGSGKSEIGRQVAKRLHKNYIDVDEEIVQQTGMSIPTIFQKVKEAGFRAIEKEVVARIGTKGGCVIATGGGVVLDPTNIHHLHQNGRIVFLDRPLSELIVDDPNRPLSQGKNAVKALYQARLALYQAYSDACVTNTTHINACVDKICAWFHDEPCDSLES